MKENVSPRVRSVKIMRIIQIFSQNNICRPEFFKDGLEKMQKDGDVETIKNELMRIKVPQSLSHYVDEAIELLEE